jgi:PIN domain nuclease of toxin-antitoxin system
MLWYTLNESQLSSTAHQLVINQNNEILISPASYREIAIKISIGKLILHQVRIKSVILTLELSQQWSLMNISDLNNLKSLC